MVASTSLSIAANRALDVPWGVTSSYGACRLRHFPRQHDCDRAEKASIRA